MPSGHEGKERGGAPMKSYDAVECHACALACLLFSWQSRVSCRAMQFGGTRPCCKTLMAAFPLFEEDGHLAN